MTATKPSLRDTMMAQKKAVLASKNLPARPGSAMAHISPVRNTAGPSSHFGAAAKPSGARTRQEGTISVNAGGMSVAPMRPARRRPEVAPRPATAGPYSVRDHPALLEAVSPETFKSKTAAPRTKDVTPKKTAQRPRPGHAPHASESSLVSPHARPTTKLAASPLISPVPSKRLHPVPAPLSSPAGQENEDMTLIVPVLSGSKAASNQLEPTTQVEEPSPTNAIEAQAEEKQVAHEEEVSEPLTTTASDLVPEPEAKGDTSPSSIKIYEDPITAGDEAPPEPNFAGPVLEDKPVNEEAAVSQRSAEAASTPDPSDSPDKLQQNSRLLDSGIARIRAKSLEVHGFRKLQSLIRDSKTVFTDEKFEALLVGLFQYLEEPLLNVAPDKVQDVKAQILATIRLLLRRERDNFQPHVSKGLESLLQTRKAYDSRAHIVSGLELLADDLVTIGDGSEIVVVLSRRLRGCADTDVEGCRMLGMGLHVLKTMLERGTTDFRPTEGEVARLAELAGRCIDSADSGVRMDAVQLCVALHAHVGEPTFWEALRGVKDDPKSLITYYIVKRQRENSVAV